MEPPAAGSLGPRLAGRLTAELILRSPQYMSCVHLYHLDLRGNRIAAIENLGATQNQFDCIDLSDNNVVRLDGFPRLERLSMFIANNNRVASIAPALEKQLPKLDTLILTNNKIERLADVAALSTCTKLTHLSLLDNPVARQRDFRLYAIFRLKSLKVLNFRKVSQKERDAAKEQYLNQTIEQVQQAAQAQQKQAPAPAAAPTNGAAAAAEPQIDAGGVTEAQKMAIQVAIANASTLEEVHRLEKALKAGQMPEGEDADADAEMADAPPGTDAMEEG
eukprot:jgi/Ulvmu1/2273/UM013_0120.1